jgi:hypothetical protein
LDSTPLQAVDPGPADLDLDLELDLDDPELATRYGIYLLETGNTDRGLEVLNSVRPSFVEFPGLAAEIAEALVAGDLPETAEAWLTDALTEAEQRAGGPSPVPDMEDFGLLAAIRWEIRSHLGLQPDELDAAVEVMIDEVADQAWPYWPREEFGKLSERWPEVAEALGPTWDEYRLNTERHLATLSVITARRPKIVPGRVSELAQLSPAEPDLDAYRERLQDAPEVRLWPPLRTRPCWCGSGERYMDCCQGRGSEE